MSTGVVKVLTPNPDDLLTKRQGNRPTCLPHKASAKELIRLMDEECRLILERALMPGADKPPYIKNHDGPTTSELLIGVDWYLSISRDWGVVTLSELFKQPTGTLLDVGACYGLLAGCAWRNGWDVSAVDVNPVPNFSGIAIPERHIKSALCNVSVDDLPFEDRSFDAVLLNEVLEHLLYPPTLLFNEIRRVLKAGGRLYLSTPNPAALSKLLRLARGKNNEPSLEVFMNGETFTHKGLTFFKSGREVRIWTPEEIAGLLEQSGMQVIDHYYYGNTVQNSAYCRSTMRRIKTKVNRWLRPLMKRNRLLGGGTLIIAEAH